MHVISLLLQLWFPVLLLALLFVLVLFSYVKHKEAVVYKPFIITAVSFHVLYAAFLSVVQYYSWLQDSFTRLFLPPYQSISYFLIYIGRFWIEVMLVLIVAFLFWLFLRGVAWWRSEMFTKKDTSLAFLLSVLVGWPNVVVFVPAIFVIALLFAVISPKKEVTMQISLFVAASVVLLLGSLLIDILNLGVLRI